MYSKTGFKGFVRVYMATDYFQVNNGFGPHSIVFSLGGWWAMTSLVSTVSLNEEKPFSAKLINSDMGC